MTLSTGTLLAVLLTLWACDKPRPDAAAQAGANRPTTTPNASDSTVRELAPWLALMATGVDTMMTLEAWITAHPADRITNRRPSGMTEETFCRSAVDSMQAGGRAWVRSAVFVIPLPPPGEVLPDPADAPGRLCTLRALWLEHPAPDPPAGILATEALRQHFWGVLGNAADGVSLSGPGTGRWGSGSSWIAGKQVVVVTLVPAEKHQNEVTGETFSSPEAAVAVSYMIGRDMDVETGARVDQEKYPKVDPEDVVEVARADSAIKWAELPGLVPLRRIFTHRLDSTHFDPRSDAPVRLPALDTLLERALATLRDTAALTAPQRAAAFLAADVAIQSQTRWLGKTPEDSARRARLEALGARFQHDHYNDAYVYRRSWLRRAYEADSLGPAGRSAFAELLRKGWNGACSPALVAERGERALRAGRADPLVHAIVAQAYADQFRGASEIADPDTLRLREPERRRAIEHYRHALAGIRDAGHRRRLWDHAVHLMLGMPIDNRYFCFPD